MLLHIMSVQVLLFASYADALGARALDVPVALPCLVRDVVDALRTLPGGSTLPTSPLVAVNQSLVSPGSPIVAGDEVALIPPVAGG